MSIQIIKTPNGDEMVVIPKADYDELVRVADAAAEDAADVAAYDAAMAELSGLHPVPVEVSRLIMKGTALLKAYRLWRNLNQVELAERAGTSQGHISDIENRRRNITPDLAPRLAAALDIPVHWLN
jgi:antitoxin component HigA of HigAB toxin-antitoxin module